MVCAPAQAVKRPSAAIPARTIPAIGMEVRPGWDLIEVDDSREEFGDLLRRMVTASLISHGFRTCGSSWSVFEGGT